MIFDLSYGPSVALRRELRRRKLIVLGKLPFERIICPVRYLLVFRVDRPPWWVAEVRPGPEFLWGDDPAFDTKLREFHLDARLVRENGYADVRGVVLLGGNNDTVRGRVDDPRIIAGHLGLGYERATVNKICVPGALLTHDIIGFAVGRNGREFEDPREIQINKGLVLFLTSARELPREECPGLEKLTIHLPVEPSLVRISKEHIGHTVTEDQAYYFAHKMRQLGWHVIVVSQAEAPDDAVRYSQDWRRCYDEIMVYGKSASNPSGWKPCRERFAPDQPNSQKVFDNAPA